MKKVMLIFGTRPEAIKLAPVIHQLKKRSDTFETVVCVTGQHREMLSQVLSLFEIVPDHALNVMKNRQNLFEITTRTLSRLGHVLKQESPGLVLVQGDTTSSFVASLAAYYLKLPVGHIEAGLRTYNKYNPFPEEKNRRLTAALADYHFAPTRWAKANLLRENVPEHRIWITGNTAVDALLMVAKRQEQQNTEEKQSKAFRDQGFLLKDNNRKLILVTGHRRESFGEALMNICAALKELAEKRRDITIVYPVHLNPNVQRPVRKILKGQPNVHLMTPVKYDAFVHLMRLSHIILTDSGGIQEEAPSLGKPVLIMRDTTERPEGVEAGTAKLIGTDKGQIVDSVLELLGNKRLYERMSTVINPYGDGEAAQRIVSILEGLGEFTPFLLGTTSSAK